MAELFVTCTYCQEDINGVRVQCCVCPDFDICLQCFAAGAEIGPHKNDHSYKFVDTCAIIIGGRGNWTGREELQLLDAVELYGFGNWDLISQYVKTRSPEEVKEEYISRFFEGNIGKSTWGEVANKPTVLIDQAPDDQGPLAPKMISKLPPLDVTPEETTLLGYKPNRDDFEREYDMQAEQLVSTLQMDATDTNVEVALKLAMVDSYTRRLRERTKRKRMIRDYQLVAKFFANNRKDAAKVQLKKDQRDLRDNMRVFSQYLTSGESERLISKLEREKELRHRLEDLLKYRNLGLQTQEEVIHYEQHSAFDKEQVRQRSGSSGSITTIRQEGLLKNGKRGGDQNSTAEKFTLQQIDGRKNNNYGKCNSSNLSSYKSCRNTSKSPPPEYKNQINLPSPKRKLEDEETSIFKISHYLNSLGPIP